MLLGKRVTPHGVKSNQASGEHGEVPSVPWHWASTVHIAVAPGIGVFKTSMEYTHGGVSLQECLVPELTISSAAPVVAESAAHIL